MKNDNPWALLRAGKAKQEASLCEILTDLSRREWQDEDVFLTRIWHEEFFFGETRGSLTSNKEGISSFKKPVDNTW